MATSGGPNIVTDGLVFGYDTGYPQVSSSVSSYKFNKGQPTTNLIPNIGTSVSGWTEVGWTGDFVISPTFENTFELTATNGWHNATYDTGITSGGTIHVGFEFKLKEHNSNSHYMFVLNGTHLGSYETSLGGATTTFEWQRYDGEFTANTNSSKVAIGLRGQDSAGLTDVAYIRNLQVELKPTSTPFINGSRSVSGSLIDLTRTTDIDLSNVSFDSNAQMTFDGTDDILNTGMFSGRNPSTDPFTVEAIIKSDVTSGNLIWLDATGNGSNQRFYSALDDGGGNPLGIQGSAWSDSVPSTTDYIHQTVVMDGSTARSYRNGVASYTKSYNSYTLSGQINIGGRSSYRWNGEIPLVKIYDRALSADEVKQNYNSLKSRFGLT
jgi:hypothetical protein